MDRPVHREASPTSSALRSKTVKLDLDILCTYLQTYEKKLCLKFPSIAKNKVQKAAVADYAVGVT